MAYQPLGVRILHSYFRSAQQETFNAVSPAVNRFWKVCRLGIERLNGMGVDDLG